MKQKICIEKPSAADTWVIVAVSAIWLLTIAMPGYARALEPSFDCSKVDSSAEEAICVSEDLAALDLELARLYGLALKGPHMTAERKATLKAKQRGWIKGRNDCWKARIGLEPCVAGSYVMRIDEIRTGYADARSDDQNGASTGPFAYRCDGFDALVSAVFVNAGTPRVSLRWHEEGVVLKIVPSGSGAKYASDNYQAGTFMFWTKADEAIFARPGEPELSCKSEPIG